MKTAWFWLLFCLVLSKAELFPQDKSKADDDLVVQLVNPNGKIKGHILQSNRGNDFYAFQEIPFALPPIGENRLQEPKPAKGWEGILNTTQNTKICIQESMGPPQLKYALHDQLVESEDCLYLNVYTPVKPSSNANLPVYVWIYGGAFMMGDATIESANPEWLIDYDIVVVAANYRVGALGFLTTDDENLPGNLGLKDQQLAIQWVSQNIQRFGGDPKKITIGGESAGASSVSYQYLTKKNNGLVRGFIQQSGTALGMTTYQPNFKNMAIQLAKLLDSSFISTDSKDIRDVLLKASVDDIRTGQSQVVSNLTNGIMDDLFWAPIIEDAKNPNAIITTYMLQDFMTGNFNRVPSLVGFNSEESLFFIREIPEGLAARAKKYDDDPSLLITLKINVTDRTQAGKELKQVYTNSTFVEDNGAFVRYSSAVGFVRPSLRQIEESSKYVPVYVYEFAYSETPSTIPGTENVPHATDIGYFWGFGSWPSQDLNVTIQTQLLTLWTNFIKYQDPTPEIDSRIGVKWPKVTEGEDIVYLNINRTLEIRSNPKQYNEVKNVLNKYYVAPYILY